MTVKLLFYNLPVISSITISSTLNKVVWLAMIAKWARKQWHIPFKRQLKNRGRFLERPGIAFWARRQILKSKPVECSSTIPGAQTRRFFFVKLSFQNYNETLILNGNTVTKTAFRARKVPGLSRNGSQEPYFYLYPFTQKENHTSILSAMASTPLSKYYESSWYYKEQVRLHLLMKNS